VKLREAASTIRSKNAGPDLVTFDILFPTDELYERGKQAEALQPEALCRLFRLEQDRVYSYVQFDPARAIKFTLKRLRPSGSAGESDVFGSQFYGPLLDLEI
jgi:hypothetical protein